jgi:hypothetical protein
MQRFTLSRNERATMTEQTIEIEAETTEEAREQIKSQVPEGLKILSEKIISDGKPKAIWAVAETTEAAFAEAQNKIPAGATILDKKELTTPGQTITVVEEFDEQGAKARLKSQIVDTAIIKALKLTTTGKQGFLGIGKKPNQYKAEIFQQAVVEIGYKTKVKISSVIGKEKKTVVTILREIMLEAGSDEEFTKSLQLLDVLRTIYNSNFSAESIQTGRQYPNSKVREYVDKFLHEVENNI